MVTILPDFSAATFEPKTPIDNPYFPLITGTIFAYEAEEDEEIIESNQLFVTFETKDILGYRCIIVFQNR